MRRSGGWGNGPAGTRDTSGGPSPARCRSQRMATPDGSGSCHLQKRDLLGLGLGFLGELCFALLVFVSVSGAPSLKPRIPRPSSAPILLIRDQRSGSRSPDQNQLGDTQIAERHIKSPRANSRQVSRGSGQREKSSALSAQAGAGIFREGPVCGARHSAAGIACACSAAPSAKLS